MSAEDAYIRLGLVLKGQWQLVSKLSGSDSSTASTLWNSKLISGPIGPYKTSLARRLVE